MLMEILIAVLVVSAIGAVLAGLLTVSEMIFRNYGPCEITINGEKKITVEGGGDLLGALVGEKIFIPSACGGRSTCGMCKLKVLAGSDMVLPTEEPHLSKEEIENNVRLSCQVKVREDMRIEIPEELFLVKEYQAVVEKITDLTHDMKEFRFKLIDPETIPFTPGHYVQLQTPKYGKGTEEVYRAYSVSSDPADTSRIELIIRLVPGGMCTTYCFEHLKEGDPVTFNGPYGEFRLSDTDVPMIFIAGGSGMAPMKCLLHQMVNEGIDRECTYFFGANRPDELCLLDLMAEFEEKLPRFKFVPVISKPDDSDNWTGETGLVTEAVNRAFSDTSDYEAYLCGSPGMIDASAAVLIGNGMPADKIYYDKFA
jgi:Na+-transporting NADH:ubiquinone oxidoreductase subunit F